MSCVVFLHFPSFPFCAFSFLFSLLLSFFFFSFFFLAGHSSTILPFLPFPGLWLDQLLSHQCWQEESGVCRAVEGAWEDKML